MRRVLPFLIILALILVQLPSLLAVPAAAAEVTKNLFGLDLIDYSTANNSGSNFITVNGATSAVYDVPNQYLVKSVDVIFNITYGPAISSLQNKWATSYFNLTILPIGNGLYRAYGNVRDVNYSSIELVFNNGSTFNTYLEIISFRVNGRFNHFDTAATLEVFHDGQSYSTAYPATSVDGSSSVVFRFGTDSDAIYDADFIAYLTLTEWKKFDYIDILINSYCNSIDSFTAMLGSVQLPYEVSFLQTNNSIVGNYLFSIQVDLRDLDRNINDDVLVNFTGTSISNSAVLNQVSIISVNGFVDSEYEGVYIPWFFKIENALKGLSTSYIQPINTAFSNLISNLNSNFSALIENDNSILGSLSTLITDKFSSLSTLISNAFIQLNDKQVIRVEYIVSVLDKYLGSSGAGQEIANEGESIKNDFELGQAQLDAVDKPSGGSISAVNSLGVVNFTANTSYLTQIVNTKYIKDVFVFVALLAVISLVLFGTKKGG